MRNSGIGGIEKAVRCALVNPNWTFHGSIYFGCREPHLPIELGYAKALLEREGHQALLVDGHLEALTPDESARRVARFRPHLTVVTTAPSYLFWRCPPPELRVPMGLISRLRRDGGRLVAVGPHGSTTPEGTLRKLGVDVVILGEFEEILPRLVQRLPHDWTEIPSLCFVDGRGEVRKTGPPHASNIALLPPLSWPEPLVRGHAHHHHRFDTSPLGLGAELEASRGCPYSCSFCAKANFRSRYRRRSTDVVAQELDGLIAQGVGYVYFIDEIFLPDRELIDLLSQRPIAFGVQTRIDLWDHEMLRLLGGAGCVSIEAGIESISEEGQRALRKRSRLSHVELTDLLIFARQHVPFVQANLLMTDTDDPTQIEEWRTNLRRHGVWANKPVPLFPYPGSPIYEEKWGVPDDQAWERAHEFYIETYRHFSDIQDQRPLAIRELESRPCT